VFVPLARPLTARSSTRCPLFKIHLTNALDIYAYLEEHFSPPNHPSVKPPLPEHDSILSALNKDTVWPRYSLTSIAMYEQNSERCKPYFRESHERWSGGLKLEQLQATGDERSVRIQELLAVFRVIDARMAGLGCSGRDDNLFLGGDLPSWTNICIASLLIWLKRILRGKSDVYTAVMDSDNGRWSRFMAAFAMWEEAEK